MADTRRVLLHIGAPKTGTTYLQAVLAHNRGELRARGILYPPGLAGAHHTAAWDLRGTPAQRKDAQGIDGAWSTLVGRANAWTGPTVVISTEMLVYCDDAQVSAAVNAFDAEVSVVYTARDLIRQVPAVWQERIKNQQTLTYQQFVEAVVDSGAMSGQHGFWRAQDAPAVLKRWSARVTAARVHVVTTPPAGQPRPVLLGRFASVLGMRLDDLSTDIPAAANQSLGLVQTELLRRYNERHGHDMSWPLYRRTVRLHLGSLFGAIQDQRRPTLSTSHRQLLRERATAMVEAIAQAGYPVTGDLSDLIPIETSAGEGDAGEAADPWPVTADELLAAAIDVLHATLSKQEASRRTNKRTAKGPPGQPAVSDA